MVDKMSKLLHKLLSSVYVTVVSNVSMAKTRNAISIQNQVMVCHLQHQVNCTRVVRKLDVPKQESMSLKISRDVIVKDGNHIKIIMIENSNRTYHSY